MPSTSAIDWPALLGRGLLCSTLAGGIQAATIFSLQAAEAVLPAPYQVEAVVRDIPHSYGEDESIGPPMITVDLGTAEDREPPPREELQKMTILGDSGSSVGQLYDIYKHCDYLCGYESEECHYVARYTLPADAPALNAPFAALPGAQAFSEYQNFQDSDWTDFFTLSTIWTTTGFSPEAWQTSSRGVTEHRLENWDDETKTVTYLSRFPDGNEHSIEGQSCKIRRSGPLTELGCNGMSLLFAAGAPRLVSYPDYNIAAARVVVSFKQGDLTYYLVKLALKAQNVFGLLVKAPEGWAARIQPRNYALLC